MPVIEIDQRPFHYRVAGEGPPVVLLHSSSSHSGQWKSLMELLSPRYQVFAPDLYGYGRSASLPRDGKPYFAHDRRIVEALVGHCGQPVHVVGHSLGGTVAAHSLIAQPSQFRSAVFIEPVLFSLIEEEGDPRRLEYLDLAHSMMVLDAFGENEASARLFLEFWIGHGALEDLDPATRSYIVETISRVTDDWLGVSSLAPGQCHLTDFKGISIPTLLVSGEKTRPAAQAIIELLRRTIPGVRSCQITGAGHMSPVTHPDDVNAQITRFLQDQLHPGHSSL